MKLHSSDRGGEGAQTQDEETHTVVWERIRGERGEEEKEAEGMIENVSLRKIPRRARHHRLLILRDHVRASA